MKRGVVRVITPGTAIDPSLIREQSNNYLMSVSSENAEFGVSFIRALSSKPVILTGWQ
jgi:DNA mismatch repair protein MutS